MEIMRSVSILVILYISGMNCESNCTEMESNSSCVPAEPAVNASTKNAACIFYNYTVKNGICRNSISTLYVFGDRTTLQYGETQIEKMQGFFREAQSVKISEQCEAIMIDLFCRYHFPACDTSLAKPHARRICRVSCVRLVHGLCEKEMVFLREASKAITGLLDENMLNCTLYDTANGGDVPECYQYHTVPGDDTKSTDCYYGVGVGYRGNVNITRSGLTCQAWRSQCPHRHWRIPEDVPEGQNDSNACRNPDSSAPDGPWCYTADPKVRWEYCNVSRCPPRVPEDAPSSLKGYPLNSTAIRISWKSLPPSRYKEQLLGYRIKYRRLASQTYKEVNITSNFTKTVLTTLVAQTQYEIRVNGFNEIGDGPASEVLLVKTVSVGEVAVDLNIELVIDADFNNDLLNRSSNKFMAMEEKIRTVIMRHFNESSILKIFDIRVLRFSMGSVEADLEILAVINSNTTKIAEALNHLVDGLDSGILEELDVSAIRVLETPQPPEDLRATALQTRYMVLQWNPPKYGNFYDIQNYTIEQKKEPSGNFIVIETLPYSRTRKTMEDLEPSTEYTIRVSSNNKYGRSEGALLTRGTLSDNFIRDLMLIIVLPLSLAVLFIVVVCIKVRPCCKTKPDNYKTQFSMQITGGDWLEFTPSDVQMQGKLGEGAFGEAYKGLVRVDNKWRECAVKKLKVNATERERRDLVNELQIMVTVGDHPNVISLIGACTRSGPILVVVRLAENGCLLTYLKKNRKNPYVKDKTPDSSQINKIRIARDVANGMLHLATKKCVHRDLAARNVLLGKNNVAMVSDFGMSRDVYESGEYESTSGGMLPIRWMALESLEDYTYVYNTKTDIWSFGVVLWEIQAGGKTPYSGLGGMEVVDFLKTGQRLKQPDGCPDEIYKIMISCWCPDPSERPSFSDLVTSLEQELLDRGYYPKEKGLETESQGNVNFSAEVDSHKENTTSF